MLERLIETVPGEGRRWRQWEHSERRKKNLRRLKRDMFNAMRGILVAARDQWE